MMRIVDLDETLLRCAIAEEADGLAAELAAAPGFYRWLTTAPSYGKAMLGDGRVLAAAGLRHIWPGRWEAWAMLSPRASVRQRAYALRLIQMELLERQADPAFRRIEMAVRADEPWAQAFGKLLGMTLEGGMTAYDPWGRDYLLFARVAEAV